MIDEINIICKNIEIHSLGEARVEVLIEGVEDEGLLNSMQELPVKGLIDLLGSEEILQEIYPHEVLNHYRAHGELDEFFEKFTAEEFKKFLPQIFKTLNTEDVLDAIKVPEQLLIEMLKERVKEGRGTMWSRFCHWAKGESKDES